MLGIRGEILTALPTPPGELTLRREHQMRRLIERMVQRVEAAVDDFETSALEWVRATSWPAIGRRAFKVEEKKRSASRSTVGCTLACAEPHVERDWA